MSENKKKGELLNQLAIISDLIENANIDSNDVTIAFSLNKEEYQKITKYLEAKSGGNIKYGSNNSIGIMMGEVRMLFTNDNV